MNIPFFMTSRVTIDDLFAVVAGLGLGPGETNSLLAKLHAAQQSFERGDRNAGRNQLNALVNEVSALKNSGRLSAYTVNALIEAVWTIISANI